MADWDRIKVVRHKEDMQVGEIRPTRHYKVLNVNDPGGFDPDMAFTFRITEACDLKCNYCHWHSGAHYKYEDILTSVDKIFEFSQKQGFKKILFYYHGGEATRHPKVVEILKYVHQKSKDTGIEAWNEMQTNLTIGEEKLRAILEHSDLFNISFHYLELLEKNKLDAFDRNWKILQDLGISIHNFDIMLENIATDDFYERILKCLEYDKIINSEMIYGFCHYKYPEDVEKKHMEFYRTHNKTEQRYDIDDVIYTTNDLFKKGIDARGWKCGAGQQSLTINGNGDVFHCGIHMTNYIRQCIPDKPYTNLVQDSSALTKLSILYKIGTTCRWDYCGGDFYLSRNPQ